MSPLIASASDTFQARKALLVVPCVISFIGTAIAPGSGNIYRLIVAQILQGFGFAVVPLAYCVPSEICPRKWRPSKSLEHCFAISWLIRMTTSGASWHERRSYSGGLRGTADHRCLYQG